MKLDNDTLVEHAKMSMQGIESKLDLCKVPEHEKREILQMVIAYTDYCSQIDNDYKIPNG